MVESTYPEQNTPLAQLAAGLWAGAPDLRTLAAYKSPVLRVNVLYSGRVQGVGFRATARAIASGHGLSGWVRNEPDGTVQLEAQGPQDSVEAFLADLRARMGRWIVSSQVCPVPVVADSGPFEIVR